MFYVALYETFNCVSILTTDQQGMPLKIKEINEISPNEGFGYIRNAANVLLCGGDLGIFHYVLDNDEDHNISDVDYLMRHSAQNIREDQCNCFIVIQPMISSKELYHACSVLTKKYNDPVERSMYWLTTSFRWFDLKVPRPRLKRPAAQS